MGHVSCGDMLRDEVAAATPIGNQAAGIMAKGELLPSSMITTMLRRRLRGLGGRRLLLDGFPRSRQNAIDFEEQCGRPELALHLVCSEEVMIERIMRRAESEGRADDTLETARRRVQVYRESGAPTMAWLREARVPIIELDCSGTPEDVWAQLLVVGRLMRPVVAGTNAVISSRVDTLHDTA
jgi:adenylate kinase